MLQVKYLLILVLPLLPSTTPQEVMIQPSGHIIRPLHGNIMYTCLPGTTTNTVQWFINDTDVRHSNLTGLMTPSFDGRIHVLRIPDLTEVFNQTTFQCMSISSNGDISPSRMSQLSLQGFLSSVGVSRPTLLNLSIISLTWTAPFSLDIPDVDPDVAYCVDVVDSTSMSTLHSQCDLIDTGFNYSIPSSGVCDDYTFTITPVNVVGNGTSVIILYSQVLTAPRVSEQQLMPLSSMDEIYTYQMTLSSLVCKSELTFEDVNTRITTLLKDSDLNISNNTIMFTTAQLNTNHLYRVSVNASNPSGSALSNTRISTHDIFTTSVEATEGSSVAIITSYFESSTASGVLYAFLFINNDGSADFDRSVYITLNKSVSLDTLFPYNLRSGRYLIFAYDIESDGLLKDGVAYPANYNSLTLSDLEEDPSPLNSPITDCEIKTLSDEVSATCVSTGLQMLVQNSNLSKTHDLHINQTTNGGQLATVQVKEDGQYGVTIFPILYEDTGIVGVSGYTELVTVGRVGVSGYTQFASTVDPRVIVGVIVVALLGVVTVVVVIVAVKCYAASKSSKVHVNPPDYKNSSTDDVKQCEDSTRQAKDDQDRQLRGANPVLSIEDKFKPHIEEYHGASYNKEENWAGDINSLLHDIIDDKSDGIKDIICTAGQEGTGIVFLGKDGNLYFPNSLSVPSQNSVLVPKRGPGVIDRS